jgi:hypothetical protein
VIAYGRDAADVALANQFGLLTLVEMKMWIDASESIVQLRDRQIGL